MPFTIGRSGGGSSALAVRNSHIFANDTARNTYFGANPSQLVEGLTVSSGGSLQKYVDSSWSNFSLAIQGSAGNNGNDGANAPPLLINYSPDGLSSWGDVLNPITHKYWRWSTDNGVTWNPVAPNVAKFNANSDAGGVPSPFEYRVSNDGKLQLVKGSTVISEADEYGQWIINSISTGTGSVHLGDLHSIGSANENVIFKNEDSTMAWHPCWGAISADGMQVIEQTARVHSGTVQVLYPAGGVGSGTVDYNGSFTNLSDVVFLYLDIIPKETYSGKLILTVKKINNTEVSKFEFQANYVNGVKTRVPFKYPLWMFNGQSFNTSITKPDGSYLKVTSNLGGDQPYRESSYRSFTDQLVFHNGNAALQATALNGLTGLNRLSAAAIRDFPVMSSAAIGMAKLGVTMTVDGNGVLNTTVSPTSIKIVANQANRLALPQSTGTTLVIQQDNGNTYGLEANLDPSTALNWKQIGTVATDVVSFNGRIGAVVPVIGDYTQKQIKTVHDTTLAEGWFGIDNTGIYWDDGV